MELSCIQEEVGWARRRRCLAVLSALGLLGVTGCPGWVVNEGLEDGNADPAAESPLGKTSGEPNNSFDDPIVAVFSEGRAELQGTIAYEHDLDVYLIERLSPGDRIVVDARAYQSSLDVSIGLFDEKGRLAFENDDRGGGGVDPLDAYIDFVVRRAGSPYYLVITHSAFGTAGSRSGSYTVSVFVESGHEVPEPEPQTLLLDFDGGFVNSPFLGRFELPEFDAADISPQYEGETATIQRVIVETVQQNYVRFQVAVISTDDFDGPGNGVSVLYFGSFNRSAFGLSEQVDLYNVDHCDDAIIYTESFHPGVFIGTPTAEELGIAIGNVASHEGGHLLGLNHTDDDRDLMDDQSPADVFIQDQEFMEAPLSSDIMPIGTQDGVLLLAETVGLSQVRSLAPSPITFRQGQSSRRLYVLGSGLRRKMQGTREKAQYLHSQP